MKYVPKYTYSRRTFIQLTAAGAGAISSAQISPSGAYPPTEESGDSGTRWVTGAAASPATQQSTNEARQTVILDGAWTVTALPLDAEGDEGYKTFKLGQYDPLTAQVPGEVHLDLMRVGLMEDPNISDNARARCRWPENHSWWYRREFLVPAGFGTNLRQQLICEGIDLYGQIFINGSLAGTTKNAFAEARLDVRHLLKEGSNELVVRVTSGMELPNWQMVPPPESEIKDLQALDTTVYAVRKLEGLWGTQRKPRCAFGTDFCDPLPNIGIWRSVRLEGRSKVIIHHLRLDTVIHRSREVSLEGEATLENLHPWSEFAALVEVRVDPPQGSPIIQHLSLGVQVGRSTIQCRIPVPEPQLWWPNGMGEQPLYRVTARVLCGNEETDRKIQMIGLRTIELDRSPLPEGDRFAIKVNGNKVFCKGGNWVPTDLIPARTDAAHYQTLVAAARDAHFNMFRVNGDSLYENDCFYDACDRAGILVWQEFLFSDTRYRDWDPEFIALVRDEAKKVVRRLRHHPALALWCGNNECQVIMDSAWKADPTNRTEIGGTRLYNEILPDICRFYDPARAYWPGSPTGGTHPNSEISGDFHGLGSSAPAGDKPSESIRRQKWREIVDASRARFVSESYAIGPPNVASVREYLKGNELSLLSTGWKIHTNDMEGGATSAGIDYHYGNSKELTLSQFILYGQMYQALNNGNLMEALRFRKDDPIDDCQGLLVWSYNDTWGEMGWSVIDHYMRRKASYYWLKRASAPVKVLVRSHRGYLVTRAVNDTLNSYEAEVRCGWVRVDGKANEWQVHKATIPSNGAIDTSRVIIPPTTERNPREWLYAATLTADGLPGDQAIWPLAPHRQLSLKKPIISVLVNDDVLQVSSPVYCHGVYLEDGGQQVLDDNYFDLLPNIPRHIRIINPPTTGIYSLRAILPVDSRIGTEGQR